MNRLLANLPSSVRSNPDAAGPMLAPDPGGLLSLSSVPPCSGQGRKDSHCGKVHHSLPPEMCWTTRVMSCCTARKNRLLIKCITFPHLLLSELTTATLSQRHRTVVPLHRSTHRATAITMGRSSFTVMWVLLQDSGHSNWNHSPLDGNLTAPCSRSI